MSSSFSSSVTGHLLPCSVIHCRCRVLWTMAASSRLAECCPVEAESPTAAERCPTESCSRRSCTGDWSVADSAAGMMMPTYPDKHTPVSDTIRQLHNEQTFTHHSTQNTSFQIRDTRLQCTRTHNQTHYITLETIYSGLSKSNFKDHHGDAAKWRCLGKTAEINKFSVSGEMSWVMGQTGRQQEDCSRAHMTKVEKILQKTFLNTHLKKNKPATVEKYG